MWALAPSARESPDGVNLRFAICALRRGSPGETSHPQDEKRLTEPTGESLRIAPSAHELPDGVNCACAHELTCGHELPFGHFGTLRVVI